MDYLLPKPNEVISAFNMLYGNDVEIKDTEPKPIDENKLYGVFVNSEGAPVAATMCDAAFGAYAGSALIMLPPGGAEDAAESGELSEPMIENIHELMNICSRLFMTDHTPHLKLGDIYSNKSDLSEDIQNMINNAQDQVGFDINFPRYGAGVISFVTT